MTAAPKDAPTDIHYSERHTGSPGMTLPEGTCPRRASLAKMLPIRHGRKGKAQETAGSLLKGNGQCCSCHFQPLLNALGERTKPRRMHENSTCTQQQRNNTRLKTPRPKRVHGTTTLACQWGQRRWHRYRFSPGQFLFSSWTRFAFLHSLSWLVRCVALHSQSCFVDLSALHALWKVRISVVWFHLQQFFVQAHASMPVHLPAFKILHSCHKIAAVTGEINLFPNRSPLLPSGREIPSFITWGRRPCCLHADMLKSPPLMSTSF